MSCQNKTMTNIVCLHLNNTILHGLVLHVRHFFMKNVYKQILWQYSLFNIWSDIGDISLCNSSRLFLKLDAFRMSPRNAYQGSLMVVYRWCFILLLNRAMHKRCSTGQVNLILRLQILQPSLCACIHRQYQNNSTIAQLYD